MRSFSASTRASWIACCAQPASSPPPTSAGLPSTSTWAMRRCSTARTLVHFDLNWNVIGISRMIVTPDKLRLREAASAEAPVSISTSVARTALAAPPHKECQAQASTHGARRARGGHGARRSRLGRRAGVRRRRLSLADDRGCGERASAQRDGPGRPRIHRRAREPVALLRRQPLFAGSDGVHRSVHTQRPAPRARLLLHDERPSLRRRRGDRVWRNHLHDELVLEGVRDDERRFVHPRDASDRSRFFELFPGRRKRDLRGDERVLLGAPVRPVAQAIARRHGSASWVGKRLSPRADDHGCVPFRVGAHRFVPGHDGG